MIKAALCIALLAGVALLGCEPGQTAGSWFGPNDPTADRPVMPIDQLKDAGNSKRYVLLVYVKTLSVSMPVGTVSGSEELWSYLDEEQVNALRSASLGRNGLRVGVAGASAWKDLQELLEKMTGQPLKSVTMVSQPGEPLSIVLKQRQPIQTVFVYSDDRTLSGADYPPADNIFTLECTLNPDDPSKIMITGVPQIRTTAQRPRFVSGPGLPSMVARPDYYSFQSATFQVMLPSKDILVVGPGSQSRRSSSIGSRFLVSQNNGVEHETVLIFMPEVFAAPLPQRAGGLLGPIPSGNRQGR
ncbi:MAG: hypothetical protein ACYTF6_05000 [Planctomycetota bacterium]|jgi:hypothetical protein